MRIGAVIWAIAGFRLVTDPLTICGWLPVGKGFLDGDAVLVGAAICPAFVCGALRWPLAIMLSADQVPVISISTQSQCCSG